MGRDERRLAPGLALLAVLFVACRARPATDVATAPFADDQAAVERTLRDLLAAAERRDVDRVEAHHLYGPKFTKFDDWAPARQDADAARRAERNGISGVVAFRPTVEDLKVDVFGPVAIATFVMPYVVVTERGSLDARARATMVFVKVGAEWKVSHEHFSAVPGPP